MRLNFNSYKYWLSIQSKNEREIKFHLAIEKRNGIVPLMDLNF